MKDGGWARVKNSDGDSWNVRRGSKHWEKVPNPWVPEEDEDDVLQVQLEEARQYCGACPISCSSCLALLWSVAAASCSNHRCLGHGSSFQSIALSASRDFI